MLTDNERFEWIENYISGQLTDEQLAYFETLLTHDPSLREEIKIHQLTNTLLVDDQLAKQKEELKQVNYAALDRKIWVRSNKWYFFILIGLVGLSATYLATQQELIDSNKMIATEQIAVDTLKNEVAFTAQEKTRAVVVAKKEMLPETLAPIDSEETISKPELTQKVSDVIDGDRDDSMQTELLPITEETVVAEQETVSQETNNTSELIIPCKKALFSIQTTPSCPYKSTGTILISTTQTGLSYLLDYGSTSSTSGEFTELPVGIYKLTITDQEQCETDVSEIEIKEKECFDHTYRISKSINQEETFQLGDHSGEFTIYHVRSGQKVYAVSFENGYPATWNAKNYTNGELVENGLYSLIIQYTNGELVKGTVTVSE
ncbi:MAG: hypothetical protein AB8B61_00895 [Cyclobacteriaceae bacterium]